MQARDGELGGDEPEDNSGCSEKTVERNFDGTLEKEDSDGDSTGQTEDGADPGLEAVAREFDGAENQGELDAFAKNHEKYE